MSTVKRSNIFIESIRPAPILRVGRIIFAALVLTVSPPKLMAQSLSQTRLKKGWRQPTLNK